MLTSIRSCSASAASSMVVTPSRRGRVARGSVKSSSRQVDRGSGAAPFRAASASCSVEGKWRRLAWAHGPRGGRCRRPPWRGRRRQLPSRRRIAHTLSGAAARASTAPIAATHSKAAHDGALRRARAGRGDPAGSVRIVWRRSGSRRCLGRRVRRRLDPRRCLRRPGCGHRFWRRAHFHLDLLSTRSASPPSACARARRRARRSQQRAEVVAHGATARRKAHSMPSIS